MGRVVGVEGVGGVVVLLLRGGCGAVRVIPGLLLAAGGQETEKAGRHRVLAGSCRCRRPSRGVTSFGRAACCSACCCPRFTTDHLQPSLPPPSALPLCPQGLEIVSVEWAPNPEGGPPKFTEVPGSERVIEADICLLAMGFLGPEATLAEALGGWGVRGGGGAGRGMVA